MLFQNRIDAGQRLAQLLRSYTDRSEVIVLALPRGGVPVAAEIADAINAPLDVLVVRKLGVPGAEEAAMGAIASGDFQYLNHDLIQRVNIPPEAVDAVIQREQQELSRREKLYRDGRPPMNLRDRTVILVDDGLATGSTMRVAVEAIQDQQPRELIVAVPVAQPEVCQQLETQVDRVICAETPRPFYAVGLWYQDFSQTSDDEVRTLLRRSMQRTLQVAGRE